MKATVSPTRRHAMCAGVSRSHYLSINGLVLLLVLAARGVLGDVDVNPAPTGVVTWLPNGPGITDLDGTRFAQHSASNFTVHYELPTEYDWDGVMVHWEGFEGQDLTAIPTFVLGVRGDPDAIKVEFEDTATNKAVARLHGITENWQYYHVSSAWVTNNRASMKVLSFVADYGMAGEGKHTGSFEVVLQGLDFDWRVDGALSGSPTHLPALPAVIPVGGANGDTVLVNSNASFIEVRYAAPTGWSGASIVYDDRDTWPTNESQNLLGYTNLVFGLYGDARNVKVEFLDSSNAVMIARATNVGSTVRYYAFQAGLLTNKLSAISAINFVVDSNLVAEGKMTGSLFVVSAGLDYPVVVEGSGSGAASVLPQEPAVEPVGGANSGTVVSVLSGSEILVHYSVTSGWSGASVLYDNFSTPEVEYADLSSLDPVVFGLTGAPQNVKCEVQDDTGRKASAVLQDIGPGLKYYGLAAADLTNKLVNRSRISVISFVVDAALAGTSRLTGSLYIASGGLDFPLEYPPNATGQVSTLPPTPLDVVPVGGANPDTRVDVLSAQRFRVTYSVPSGWSGSSVLYDDYGSGPVETGDFSALTSVVFAIRGDPAAMKIEFEDADTNKVEGLALSITDKLQYYAISVASLSNKGLNISDVRMVNFVVDSNRAGVASLSGRFEVYTAGLTFRNLVYRQADTDGDGLPDDWEEKAGFDPEDDGSGNPDYGAAGDGDGDGVDNYTEFVAGTSASSADETLVVELTHQGTNIHLAIEGYGRREYRFYATDHLVTGQWARVGPAVKLGTDTGVVVEADISADNHLFYRCLIRLDDLTRLPGGPRLVEIGGGESNTVIGQVSSYEFLVDYNVTQGWAGATLLYDDFGTPEIESADFSAYTELMFAISGTPHSVKYEIVDAADHKITGWFQYVTNAWNYYALDASLITAGGVDLSEVRFINVLVDAGSAGAGGEIGSFGVRIGGLDYLIETHGQLSGEVTVLPPGPPVISSLGGGQSTNHWKQFGVTDVVVPYDVRPTNTWDGISILYDNYGTPQMESADFSDLASVTFGVGGTPAAVKIEFEDIAANKALAYLRGVTNTVVQYYTVDLRDVEAGGLDSGHMRFVNFVVDQAAAGAGNHTGTFWIVTDGLAP